MMLKTIKKIKEYGDDCDDDDYDDDDYDDDDCDDDDYDDDDYDNDDNISYQACPPSVKSEMQNVMFSK